MTVKEAEHFIHRHIKLLEFELRVDVGFKSKNDIISNLQSCQVMLQYLECLRYDIPVNWVRIPYATDLIPMKIEA